MIKVITTKSVDALAPTDKPYEVRDTTLPGFLLRVQPSGTMSYYVAYRNQAGKKNRYKLGSHPVMTAWDFEKHRQFRLKNTPGKSSKEPGQATINRDQAHMRAALSRAVQWGHLESNPLDGVKKAKEDRNRKIRALEQDEEERILKALRKERTLRKKEYKRLEAMVIVSIDTGVRQGELFGLQWADVDLKTQILHVRGEGAKSSQSRTIPLSPRGVDALTAWKAQNGPVTNSRRSRNRHRPRRPC